MEHNTDRILWTVLILAIGVALYVGFRPAIASQAQTVVQTISNLNGVDSSSNSDFSYSAPNTADDTISIIGYKGHKENLIIPEYRKIGSVDYKITAISHDAFRENTSIEQVTIPDSVQTIGYNAFWHDSNLKQLTLGSNVKKIGKWAFQWTALTSVNIPDSVTSIGEGAFYRCYYLKQLTLGSGVTSISAYAFQVTGLTSVDFPANVKSIGYQAFQWTAISAISFRNRVDLGHDSFTHTNLTNVTLPTGSTYNTQGSDPTFDSTVNVTIK